MTNKLKTWCFGIDNDKLVELVLSGEKTATTSLYDKDNIPKVGEKSILVYENKKEACITETKEVIITQFKNITEELAKLEGEGDKSLDYWRKTHYKFFKSIDSNFNENSIIIFEIFEVIENLNEGEVNI